MLGRWFSKSDKPQPEASGSPVAPVNPEPPVSPTPQPPQSVFTLADADGDARTIVPRAKPATLFIGAPPGAQMHGKNEFDAETIIMRPGTSFEQATIFAGARTPNPAGPDTPLSPGTKLNNRYEVIKPIGRGGFSYVYLCQHLRNGRLMAVKEAYGNGCSRAAGLTVVAPDTAALARAKAALLREVAAVSRISNAGVVRFEDVFEANGTLCFAMDFIEGEPLSALLSRRRGVSPASFVPMANSLFDAVETLHANDVLHGDIKPGNIILRPDKSVVLIDFGSAARLSDLHYDEPTVTPGYSAPERYAPNRDVGAWSDIYSCAATLAAAIVGAPPPDSSSPTTDQGTIAKYLDRAAARMGEARQWTVGLGHALRADANERPASIADMRAALALGVTKAKTGAANASPRGDGQAIFVSYAHADAASVETMVRAIQRRGAGVWIDRQGIKPGSRAWGNEILNGMRAAQIVLLFSSVRSMASDNVKDEIYTAKELAKPIVVARLDETPFSDEVLMFLTRSQHISVQTMAPAQFADAIVSLLDAQASRAI